MDQLPEVHFGSETWKFCSFLINGGLIILKISKKNKITKPKKEDTIKRIKKKIRTGPFSYPRLIMNKIKIKKKKILLKMNGTTLKTVLEDADKDAMTGWITSIFQENT